MANLKDEVLRLVVDRLQNKVESIMMDVNIAISNPEGVPRVVDKISDLMIELAMAESALLHAKNLYNQSLALSERIQEIQKQAIEALEKKSE